MVARRSLAVGPVAALGLLLMTSLSAKGLAPSSTPVEYFGLEPGTPVQDGTSFDLPVFVLGEPAGAPANQTEVTQVWQNLQVLYLGPAPAGFPNWSVPSSTEGSFVLDLSLTSVEVSAIESGDALLALNSSVVVNNSILGASGVIDGPLLSSSVVVGAWWSTLFGIPTPPPDPSLSSFQGIISDLAWFGSSTAGRAAYAASTIVAILLYLWEGHKLARAKLLGKPLRREAS